MLGKRPKRLPSAGAFDHVVTRAQIGGRTYWIDPTRDREVGTLEERTPLPFGKGLPICADCGALVTIPRPMPLRPEVDVGQHIRLDEDGDRMSADFVVVTDYAPDHAVGIREDFDSQGNEEVGSSTSSTCALLRHIHGKGAPTVDERTSPHGLRTLERYRLDWTPGDEGTEFGIVFFQLLDWVPNLKEDTRNAPLAFTGPRFARQSIRTTFAGGWALPEEKVSVSNPFFDFHRTVEVSGSSLLIPAEWRRLSDEIPAKNMRDSARTSPRSAACCNTCQLRQRWVRVVFRSGRVVLAAAVVLALAVRSRCSGVSPAHRFAGALLAPARSCRRSCTPPECIQRIGPVDSISRCVHRFRPRAEYAARPTARTFLVCLPAVSDGPANARLAVLVRWSFRPSFAER